MQIELLEPGLAIPKGRGYVGIGDSADTKFFPHVDSCLAVVGIFKGGTIIGGHVVAQWPGMSDFTYAFSGNRIFTLMEANRKRVGATEISSMIFVYPRSQGKWTEVVTTIWKAWNPPAVLEVNTTNGLKKLSRN